MRLGNCCGDDDGRSGGRWDEEFIDPETAKRYLATQAKNRAIRRARVLKYARSILKGRYRVTHQGIAFDKKGRLRDGQHRLLAIIEANVGIWIWVYRGLGEDSMIVVDTHDRRTDADSMFLEGFDGVTGRHVAVAKRMAAGNASGRAEIEFGANDRDELRSFLERHWAALQFAISSLSTQKGVGHASVAACVARAYYHADHARLSHFCEVLKTGFADSKDDFAAVRLRKLLMESPSVTGGGDSTRAMLYRKVSSALQAFLERRNLTKIYEAESELFPLPVRDENQDRRTA